MSDLVKFYREEARNCDGLFLDDMLNMSDHVLEAEHGVIQWLFPLIEPSQFNADAPLLTAEDIATWHEDKVLRINLMRSYDKFLHFMALKREGIKIEMTGMTTKNYRWFSFNHNWLRITRVLKCMTLLGFRDHALGFFYLLEDFKKNQQFPISDNTFKYWTEAVS